MDILAHGLWSNIAYECAIRAMGRKSSKKERWLVVFFGVFPDIFAFAVPFITSIFGDGTLGAYAKIRLEDQWRRGIFQHRQMGIMDNADLSLVPSYVFDLYSVSHSLLIFVAIFLTVWVFHKKPYWVMGGWGLHVVTDIVSHNDRFFPTPLLYPVSDFHVSGISWADPRFMAVNYTLLIAVNIMLFGGSRNKITPNNSA